MTLPTPPLPSGPVLVMGAGAVGCYLGGALAASGLAVTLVGRARVLDGVQRSGLLITDLDHASQRIAPGVLGLSQQVSVGMAPALVLLCVKSPATADAAARLQACLPVGTLVVSMQNGISNAAVARRAAPGLHVLPGMVPYNVAQLAEGHFHRGTSGDLAAQDHPLLRPWLPRFAAAGLPLQLYPDLAPVQWGKLLLNLNNPINALSGQTLRAQLLQRGYRQVLAALIEEALAVLRVAAIAPAKITPVAPHLLPRLLRLPTPLFRILAARMLRMDDKARSSMADDLARHRPTEIDALCGEVVRLAAAHGLAAPLNAEMARRVAQWSGAQPPLKAGELLYSLGLKR